MDSGQRTKALKQLNEDYKKRNRPARFVAGAINLGVGFSLGFMDGQGISIGPTTKYTLLATPTVLAGLCDAIIPYGVQSLLKYDIENKPFEKRLEKIPVSPEERESIAEMLNDLAYTDLNTPLAAIKSMGRAAMRTSLGYLCGYYLAKSL